jgi:hypothetical protein
VPSYLYLTPAGTQEDKRKWPKGTPVSATLLGGSILKGVTAAAPRQFGGAAWGVRVHGVPYVIALDRVDRRYQSGLFESPEEGTSGSEKETSTARVGHPAG